MDEQPTTACDHYLGLVLDDKWGLLSLSGVENIVQAFGRTRLTLAAPIKWTVKRMANDEIESVIDQAAAIAMAAKDEAQARTRLGYLLRPVLERIEPISWEVKTKGGEVECRIAKGVLHSGLE